MTPPFDGLKLVVALKTVTAGYRSAYQESPFPNLVDRFIDLQYQRLTIDYSVNFTAAIAKMNELNLEMQYWNIDLQFAMIK